MMESLLKKQNKTKTEAQWRKEKKENQQMNVSNVESKGGVF